MSQSDLLSLARNDILLSEVFKCFADVELEEILKTYQSFRVHLTSQAVSDRSVVLSATHFITLHGLLQRNMMTTTARQASKSAAVSPISPQVLSSKYGEQHWSMTSYGLEYQQLQIAGNTSSSLAFGI